VLEKQNKRPKKPAFQDVAADDPEGTMDRFAAGLKRVLAAPKAKVQPKYITKKRLT
jgi:hypothetical protein